jgi:hypothetical protein
MKKWWFFYGFKILICMTAGVLAIGFIVMTLWNWLLPDVFHSPALTITFIQALGLLVLSRILFGGFKRWGCGNGCNEGKRGHWRKRFEEKLASMSPEEREKVKQQYKKCCNWGRSDEEESKSEPQ